jgi:uncharacterized membrane protein YhaH (DUF805 family)
MAAVNPYLAPAAAVADVGQASQPVRLFAVSGRIGRARYMAYSTGLNMVFWAIVFLLATVGGAAGGAFMLVAWIPMLILFFMLTIQRSHDFNLSGWVSILMLVPLLNLMFLVVPGTDGANRYGAPTPPNSVGVLIAAWILPAIATLGLVAAVSIPAYQDYVKRAEQGQVQKR